MVGSWALAILLYELLVGNSPFEESRGVDTTYDCIMRVQIVCPNVSSTRECVLTETHSKIFAHYTGSSRASPLLSLVRSCVC